MENGLRVWPEALLAKCQRYAVAMSAPGRDRVDIAAIVANRKLPPDGVAATVGTGLAQKAGPG